MSRPITVIRQGRREARLGRCESCGSEHMAPVPCGLSFSERIRTVQTSTDWMPARRSSGRPYYDREAVKDLVGPDARERMLHETRGLGAVQRASDGSEWVYDDPKTGELRPMANSDLIGGYLRGTPESELESPEVAQTELQPPTPEELAAVRPKS